MKTVRARAGSRTLRRSSGSLRCGLLGLLLRRLRGSLRGLTRCLAVLSCGTDGTGAEQLDHLGEDVRHVLKRGHCLRIAARVGESGGELRQIVVRIDRDLKKRALVRLSGLCCHAR